MCIRDSNKIHKQPVPRAGGIVIFIAFAVGVLLPNYRDNPMKGCLLYTSDAADERSSVDLGGRRIINKKKKIQKKKKKKTNKNKKNNNTIKSKMMNQK
mgnify:CR=1 FL=1